MNTIASSEPQGRESDTRRGLLRWLGREVLGIVIVVLSLFLPAGRWDWVMGWALVGIYVAWTAATALLVIPRSPEMLIERATRRKDMKSWDALILSVIGLTTLAKHLTAGFDVRFGWTRGLPPALPVAALIVAALGYAVLTWAMAANAFFSLVVRIQEDRGQAVVSSGPYRFVRHPGYVGTLAFELATPIMLGSLWALIAGGLAALLTVVRTALEDRTLLQQLDGYEEYAQRVRYRLLPGIW